MEAVVDRLVVDSNVAFSEDFACDRTLIVNPNNGALPKNAKIIFTQPLVNQEITFEEKTAKSCEKEQEKSPETTTNQKVGTSNKTGKQNLSSEEKLEIIAEAKLTSNRQSYIVPSTIEL